MIEILAGGNAISGREERAYELVGLHPDQIMVLRYEPVGDKYDSEEVLA